MNVIEGISMVCRNTDKTIVCDGHSQNSKRGNKLAATGIEFPHRRVAPPVSHSEQDQRSSLQPLAYPSAKTRDAMHQQHILPLFTTFAK